MVGASRRTSKPVRLINHANWRGGILGGIIPYTLEYSVGFDIGTLGGRRICLAITVSNKGAQGALLPLPPSPLGNCHLEQHIGGSYWCSKQALGKRVVRPQRRCYEAVELETAVVRIVIFGGVFRLRAQCLCRQQSVLMA